MNQAHMLAQFKKVQAEMAKAQEELKNTIVSGSAGGGTVTVDVTCDQRVTAVRIGKEAVDPEDVETLEDLVAAAVNDALTKASEASQKRMSSVKGACASPDSRDGRRRTDRVADQRIQQTADDRTEDRRAARFLSLNRPRHEAQSLAEAILAVKDNVRFCSICYSLAESDPCEFCSDERRDAATICVVAEAKDVYAIERTGAFKGRYHVLGGLISPMDGIGPAQLHVKELIERVGREEPSEIILATNPNAEGEATALYLSRLLQPLGVAVTRLAYGLPIGGDLDYADEMTITKALEGRRAV